MGENVMNENKYFKVNKWPQKYHIMSNLQIISNYVLYYYLR